MTEEKKRIIVDALKEESDTVLSLAYVYAKGYELSGEDVTKRWETATLQSDALNRAYRKGYSDALNLIKNLNKEGNS